MVQKLRKHCTHVVQYYLDYKAHVRRQVHQSDIYTLEQQLNKHEAAWLENNNSTFLATVPEYLREASGDDVSLHDSDQLADNIVKGEAWLDKEPLAACRRKDNSNLCKADLPRMKW